MNKPTPQQLKKLEKLAKVLDGGDIELLTQINKLEEKLETEIQAVQSVVTDALAIAEQTKKLKGEDGYTPIKGVDYFDGKDGSDYKLTDKDKKEIAKSIPVPVVEKVIEKTVVKEVPIVTNEIVKEINTIEVAVLDETTVAYLESEIKRVEESIPEKSRETNFGFVIRDVVAGDGVTIDKSDPNRPVVSASGGAGEWGAITGTLSDQTDLQSALDGKANSLGADDNYVTDAEKVKLSNLSGTNTGDQNLAPYLLSATAATTYEPIKGTDDNYVTDAEKAALHAAVTVTDSAEINFTLVGQDITANIIAGSIDETKLDVSTNASLDLADSAVQPAGLTNYFLKTADDTDDISVGTTNKFATAAEKTKLGFISVTQAVDLDTMESDIANKQPLDADLTTIAGLTATTDNFIQSKAGAWASRTVTQVKTDLGLTGTNSGDQTSIVGITGTKAQFDTAVTDGNFLYVGDVTTNATHTGEVTGSTSLAVDKTAITNKTLVTASVGDYVLIADASDSDNLKRVTVQTIIDLAGGGSVSDAAYDASWNGDTTTAPSKNAVYDKIETLSAGSGLTALQVASLISIRF